MRVISRMFVGMYRLAVRVRAKIFSMMIGGAFAEFGANSVIECPLRLSGEDRVRIGASVFIAANTWIHTLPDGANVEPAISIGNGTSIAGACVISAVRSVVLEENVLLARNVYISDHIHRYDDESRPIQEQGVDKVAPVRIGRGAWLGQNVVVCPGVTIGSGSVIGANSVVNSDIPERTVAVGAPARVIKQIAARACSK
jgi:acetyltransferase-like isoleucine patch superfamily enzyme